MTVVRSRPHRISSRFICTERLRNQHARRILRALRREYSGGAGVGALIQHYGPRGPPHHGRRRDDAAPGSPSAPSKPETGRAPMTDQVTRASRVASYHLPTRAMRRRIGRSAGCEQSAGSTPETAPPVGCRQTAARRSTAATSAEGVVASGLLDLVPIRSAANDSVTPISSTSRQKPMVYGRTPVESESDDVTAYQRDRQTDHASVHVGRHAGGDRCQWCDRHRSESSIDALGRRQSPRGTPPEIDANDIACSAINGVRNCA